MLTKKWRFNQWGLFVLLGLLVLAGCGDDQIGGAGQCGGADTSGLCVTVDLIIPGDGNTDPTDSVDAFAELDCDGDPETNDGVLLFSHFANVTLSVENLIPTNLPGTTPGVPTFVTLTQYAIEYFSDVANVQPVPVLTNRVFNESIRIDVDGEMTTTLTFVEFQQKAEYREAALQQFPGLNPIHSYTAKYTFSGQDSLGNSVSVAAFKQFEMGDFNSCEA